MIYVVIGTKAQYIKMAPVIREFRRQNVPICIVDLAQHPTLSSRIMNTFELSEIECRKLFTSKSDVSTVTQAFSWITRFLFALTFKSDNLKQVFYESLKQKSYIVVHGDTLSTFLGSLIASKLKIRLALVEAGLTSGKILNPFPEEIIRRLVQRRANILFCPGNKEKELLKRKNLKAEIVCTNGNTVLDSLKLVSKVGNTKYKNYVLFSIHRFETISRKSELDKVFEYLRSAVEIYENVIFCMHESTRKMLEKFELLSKVQALNIEIIPLQPYDLFVKLIMNAEVIFTDGGSIQEEAAYLNKKFVVMRNYTERSDGMGDNGFLTNWNAMEDYQKLTTLKIPILDPLLGKDSPSENIVFRLKCEI